MELTFKQRCEMADQQAPLAETADHRVIALALLQSHIDGDSIATAIRTQNAELLLSSISDAVNAMGREFWKQAYKSEDAGTEFANLYNKRLARICDANAQ